MRWASTMKPCAQFSAQLDKGGPNQALRRSPYRSSFLASIAGAIAAVVCLQSCVSIETPRAGQPVVIGPGQALVFGRIRMLSWKNEKIEHSAFQFDPLDQPFFGTGPRMTLELRQLFPPGGMYKYKTHPTPPIQADGSFFWVLSAGDYELLGNPRLYGSKNFSAGETETLARFSVSANGKTMYVGTLVINVDFDLVDFSKAYGREEAEYRIRSLRVVDERERALPKLRERFPVFPEPVVTERMRTE